jgi:2-phosphosulfolactate phosphatase
MRTVDVCLTPELLHLYDIQDKIVVVVDIFRATSCMTTAFAHGVARIIPVAELEECRQLQASGLLAAAERDAKKAEGFDLDNSPFSYMDPKLQGHTIAVTTTNGTQAITRSRDAAQIIIGSFLNKATVIEYLREQSHSVLVLCAGWKGKINMEDSLFAGAVVCGLEKHFAIEHDSALLALHTYNSAKFNMLKYLAASSHLRRLHRLGLDRDIEFCLREDLYQVLPVFRDNALVKL